MTGRPSILYSHQHTAAHPHFTIRSARSHTPSLDIDRHCSLQRAASHQPASPPPVAFAPQFPRPSPANIVTIPTPVPTPRQRAAFPSSRPANSTDGRSGPTRGIGAPETRFAKVLNPPQTDALPRQHFHADLHPPVIASARLRLAHTHHVFPAADTHPPPEYLPPPAALEPRHVPQYPHPTVLVQSPILWIFAHDAALVAGVRAQ